MTFTRFGATYSRWDGTQQISPLDADDLMRAMSDDLMQNGDLNVALQRLFRWGFERPDGEHVPGLRELLQRLKDRRQEQLNRYDLGGVLDDIKERLQEIKDTERSGIERRLEPSTASPASEGERGETGEGGEQPASGGARDASSGEGGSDEDLRRMLEQLAKKKLDQLNQVPEDPAGAIRALNEYEFMDPEARRMFQELLAMLQQQVLQSTFQGMQQALGQMTPQDIADMRQMLCDLNELLEAQQRGENPDFAQFMHKWGHYFGPDIQSLDDLLQHMQRQMSALQQLMESMSPEQRGQLEAMVQAIMRDEGLQQEMARLGDNLGQMMPRDWRRQYTFSGDESLTLEEAMRMMERLRDYDQLEDQLRDVRDWNDLAALDDEKFRDLLGEEEHEQAQQLQQI